MCSSSRNPVAEIVRQTVPDRCLYHAFTQLYINSGTARARICCVKAARRNGDCVRVPWGESACEHPSSAGRELTVVARLHPLASSPKGSTVLFVSIFSFSFLLFPCPFLFLISNKNQKPKQKSCCVRVCSLLFIQFLFSIKNMGSSCRQSHQSH